MNFAEFLKLSQIMGLDDAAALAAQPILSVEKYGVKKDNTPTQNRAALQAAFDDALTGKYHGIMLPDYLIHVAGRVVLGKTNLDVITGLRFFGLSRGGSGIVQDTDGEPIIEFKGQYIHTLRFEHMKLSHLNMQTGKPLASVFYTAAPHETSIYNCVFEDIGAENFYWFFNAPDALFWGNTYYDMWLGDFAGGVNNITGTAGEPNCRFERMYITCQSAAEQYLFRHDALTAQYENIEVNSANMGAGMIYDGSSGTHIIGHWALEGAHYTQDRILFNVPNGILLAKFIYTETLLIAANKTVYAFSCEGERSYIDVECYSVRGMDDNNVGKLVAALANGPRQISFGQVFMPWANNVMLTDVINTGSADFVTVRAWNDMSPIAIQGDANVTFAHNDKANQIFDTPLTAKRIAKLPVSGPNAGNQLFGGRRFRITKTNKSAFVLELQDAGGTVIGSIAASQRGVLEVVWHRSGGAAGFSWILTDSRTY